LGLLRLRCALRLPLLLLRLLWALRRLSLLGLLRLWGVLCLLLFLLCLLWVLRWLSFWGLLRLRRALRLLLLRRRLVLLWLLRTLLGLALVVLFILLFCVGRSSNSDKQEQSRASHNSNEFHVHCLHHQIS
jgi:hypothetical protein